jgi:hypothetical protein
VGLWQIAFHAAGEKALSHAAAPLGARGHFLSDEAALLEVDAVQIIEVYFEREGAVRLEILRGVADAERDAMAVIFVGRCRAGIL